MALSHYNPERCLRIPADARLYITIVYGVALGLLIAGTIHDDGSILRAWAIFLALGATTWTCVTLHCYSRRVILEVMSWEHRQQGMTGPVDNVRSLVDESV